MIFFFLADLNVIKFHDDLIANPDLEMQRTLQLQQTFALHVAPTGFINTGINEYDVGHKGGMVLEPLDVPLADRLSLERAETSQLQK